MLKIKKFLASVLSISIVFTMFQGIMNINSFAGETNAQSAGSVEIWDGTYTGSFASGTGTRNDPYIIVNGAQLHKMVSDSGKKSDGTAAYYKLASDIYLNSSSSDKTNEWNLSGHNTEGFVGHLDGDFHTVYGLYAKYETYERGGLIPVIADGASVTGLNIEDVTIEGGEYVGALSAWQSGAVNVIAVTVKDVNIASAGNMSAGLIAACVSSDLTMRDCAFLGGTLTAEKAGGLFGDRWTYKNMTIADSFSVGCYPVSVNNVTNVQDVNYSNVYTDTATSATIDENTSLYKNLTVLENSAMQGTSAVTTMKLNSNWQATATYPIVVNDAFIEIWDGTTDTTWEGTGTEKDPYKITTGAELRGMISVKGLVGGEAKYFELQNDIYLNDISTLSSWATTAPANNWYDWTFYKAAYHTGSSGFGGVFDGGYHTIYGLYANYTEGDGNHFGLFPELAANAVIKNITISDSYIYGKKYMGALVGYIGKENTTLSCCGVTESVTVTTTGEGAGGLVGAIGSGTTITNCYSLTANVTAPAGKFSGGLVGDGWATTNISNSFTVGIIPVARDFATYNNVYTTVDSSKTGLTKLDAAQMQGADALTTMSLSTSVWEATETYPEFKSSIIGAVSIWDGTTDTEWEGSGTDADPYKIYTGAELRGMISTRGLNAEGTVAYCFELQNDIYLNDILTLAGWATTEPVNNWYDWTFYSAATNTKTAGFCGVFDGGYHTVYGLYVKSTDDDNQMGLIPRLSTGATVKNLTISDAYIEADSYVGGIVGAINHDGLTTDAAMISRCGVTDSVTLVSTKNDGSAGGLAGCITKKTNIDNCYSLTTSLTAPVCTAGIYGDGWGSGVTSSYISNSFSVAAPYTKSDSFAHYINVYTTVACSLGDKVTVLSVSQMKGADAVDTMKLPKNIWEATVIFPIIKISDAETVIVWDGTTDTTWEGSGTDADPYKIYTGAELRGMISTRGLNAEGTVAYCFELQNDIYLNDILTLAGWATTEPVNNWYDWTFYSAATNTKTAGFCGVFDGGYHTVYGLYVKSTDDDNQMGLIPRLSTGATVKNLTISDAYIEADSYVGGIVGAINHDGLTTDAAMISRCGVTDSVTLVSTKNDGSAGGLAGCITKKTNIDNCYSLTTSLTAPVCTAGIYGDGWGSGVTSSYISNSFSVAAPYTKSDSFAHYINVYTTVACSLGDRVTVLKASDMQNAAAITNMQLGTNWLATESYPRIRKPDETFISNYAGIAWDGTESPIYSSGAGTEAEPYTIKTAEQLRKMVISGGMVNGKAAHFKLVANINLGNINWYYDTPDIDFVGIVNGNGYEITGLLLEGDNYAGLIQRIGPSAEIKNLHIKNSKIASANSGALVGYAKRGKIIGCSIDKTVTITGSSCGAAIGIALAVTNPTRVEDCIITASNNISGNGNPETTRVLTNETSDYTGFADNYHWYQVPGKQPLLKNYGYHLVDVSCDDNRVLDDNDILVLRKYLLGAEGYKNIIADIDYNNEEDIRDILRLKKNIKNPTEIDIPVADAYDYNLVWRDEFDTEGAVDSTKWNFKEYMSGVSDLQVLDTSDVATVTTDESGNSVLRLTAYKDGETYKTNKSVTTGDKMEFKYGYLELRAKVPTGQGVWPSFWAKSDTFNRTGSPHMNKYNYAHTEYGAEVDMFEVMSGTNAVSNLHKWWLKGTDLYAADKDKGITARDTADLDTTGVDVGDGEYHKFGFEWTPKVIRLTCDGVTYCEYDLTKNFVGADGLSESDMNGFQNPLCIILNNFIFTPGYVTTNTWAADKEVDNSFEKSVYDIDYIRLYQTGDGQLFFK